MKKTLAAAAVVVLVAGLTGCGGDDDKKSGASGGDSYCDTAKDVKGNVEGLDLANLSDDDFEQIRDNFDALEKSAPDSVKDSWKVLGDKFDELDDILSDAGISLDDLTSMQTGEVPEGLDATKLQELTTRLQDFSDTSDVDPALEKIQANLKDECGIDVGDDTDSTN